MVFPRIADDFSFKFFCVVASIAQIKYLIMAGMLFFKELANVANVISIDRLKSRCGEGHSNDPFSDIRDIKIVFVALMPIPLSRDLFP